MEVGGGGGGGLRAQPPSVTITVLTFLVKKSTMKNFGGLAIF